MGVDYSFELIFIETYAPKYIGHNKFFLGSVYKNEFRWVAREMKASQGHQGKAPEISSDSS